jgi:hypothetical protein
MIQEDKEARPTMNVNPTSYQQFSKRWGQDGSRWKKKIIMKHKEDAQKYENVP